MFFHKEYSKLPEAANNDHMSRNFTNVESNFFIGKKETLKRNKMNGNFLE